jgi:hypothetical protein
MNDQVKTEQPNEAHISPSELNAGLGTLLPCPFCGGEPRPTAHLTYSWFAPVCRSCGVDGPQVRIEAGTDPQTQRELMNKADALWNTRVPNASS